MVDRGNGNNRLGFESGQSYREKRFVIPIAAVLRER
jgi:hypothetical protein